MATRLPWDPWEDAERWADAFGRPHALSSPLQWIWGGGAAARPPVEVARRGQDVVLRAELPGLSPSDIDVRVEPDAVVLRGELRAEQQGDRDGVYHSERRYGSFVRRVRLPVPVAAERARAVYRHGVLEVVVPARAETPGAPRVPVEVQG